MAYHPHMRFHAMLALALTILGCEERPRPTIATPAPPPEALPAEVDGMTLVHPGRGIGPVRLGMSATEVRAAVRLTRHPASTGLTTLPYTLLWNREGLVQGVVANVTHATAGFRVGDATIPAGADLERAAALLGDCVDDTDDIERAHVCREGEVRVSEGPNFPGEVWLTVGAPYFGEMTAAQVVAQRAVIEP